MQDIRDLSNEELLTILKEPGSPSHLVRKQRSRLEKKLFLRTQTRSPPPQKREEVRNAYFLLDLRLPQHRQPGKSILKQERGRPKTVRVKPTEIFGEETVLPHCNKRFNHNAVNKNLHAQQCPNAASETPEVLGEQTWLNRQFHLNLRFSI